MLNTKKEQSAVEYCEETYPEMTFEFRNILDEMYWKCRNVEPLFLQETGEV